MLGIITTKDIVTYMLLSRKKKELEFKKSYLATKNENNNTTLISTETLEDALKYIDEQLGPLEMKMTSSGILNLQLHADKINKYTEIIKKYDMKELANALTMKEGELYEVIVKRSELLKENLNKKEELAELIVLINAIPRSIAENIKKWVEEGTDKNQSHEHEEKLDLSSVNEDKRIKLLNLLNRLGISCYLKNDLIIIGDASSDNDTITWKKEIPRYINDEKIWVPEDKIEEFNAMAKELDEVSRRIQAITARKQVEQLDEEQEKEFAEYQNRYLELIKKRNEFKQQE